MIDMETAFFELLEPESPSVAVLGEGRLRTLAERLAATARDAVSGILLPGECDIEMRRIMRGSGYPWELAAPAARRMVEHIE